MVVTRYSEVAKRYVEVVAVFSEVAEEYPEVVMEWAEAVGRYVPLAQRYSEVVAGYPELATGYYEVSPALVNVAARFAAFAAASLFLTGSFERGRRRGFFFEAPDFVEVGGDFGDETGGSLKNGLP